MHVHLDGAASVLQRRKLSVGEFFLLRCGDGLRLRDAEVGDLCRAQSLTKETSYNAQSLTIETRPTYV